MNETARPTLELLSPAQVDRIIDEACRVLETSGISVDNTEGRALLLDSGASEAMQTETGPAGPEPAGAKPSRLCLPEAMVRQSIPTAPSRIAVYDREGVLALDLSGRNVHFDPGSAAIHLFDAKTGRRREAVTRDLIEMIRLVEALPDYAAQSTALLADDVPAEIADSYRLYLALKHGSKPVVTGTFRKEGFTPMRAMLAAARGGEGPLREKPLAIFDCCPSPPLHWSDLTCQALLDCARAGIPAELVSMPLAGATAPVTLREAVVQHCAENLSGIVLHQLAAPGAPILYGGAPAAFDMRHGTTPMGAIETMMIQVAYAQVGRRLGLPTHGYLCLSDAKTPDYQAGLESGIGAVLAALAGINVVSGPGILDYILTQSLEKLVLDHEACGIALRLARGLDSPAADAAALIAELVRTGEFLSHEHTRREWRRVLRVPSAVIDRDTWLDWEGKGALTALERAGAEVGRLLARTPSRPPAPEVEAALDEIMKAEAGPHGLEAVVG